MRNREDIIVRLQKAYAFLRDDGRFITADATLAAIHEINSLRSRRQKLG